MRPYIIGARAPGAGADAAHPALVATDLFNYGFDGRYVGIILGGPGAGRHCARGGHEGESGGDDYIFHGVVFFLNFKIEKMSEEGPGPVEAPVSR